jgi:predicted transcriptional regulator
MPTRPAEWYWVYCGQKKGEDLMMQDEQPTASVDRELATQIVAAYVRRNQIGSDQLPALIATVCQALGRLGTAGRTGWRADPRSSDLPIRSPRLCRGCGMRRGQTLRRHIAGHGLSVEQYRIRWNLPRDHTPWSLRPIARVAPRWPSSLGSVSAVGDREQHHRKPRHRQDDRGDRERREVDRSRRA